MKATVFADGKASESRRPRRPGRPGEGVAREAGGGRRRDRRRPARKYLEEGSLGEAEMVKALRGRHRAAARSCPSSARPPPRASAATPLLDLIVEEFPSPARPRRGERHRPQGQADRRPRARRQGAGDARWCSRRCQRSARRQALALPRLHRHAAQRLHARSTPRRGGKERMGHIVLAAGQDAEDRGGARARARSAWWPSSRRRRRATRSATRRTRSSCRGSRSPSPPSPSRSSRRRAATRTRSRSRCARIAEEDPTVHYHFDPETKQLLDLGRGQPARRDGRRAHEAQVQRRRQPAAARASPTRRR